MMDADEEARAAWDDRMTAVHHGCLAAICALEEDGILTPSLSADEAADLLFALLSVRTWEQLRIEFGWTQERYLAVIQDRARALLT